MRVTLLVILPFFALFLNSQLPWERAYREQAVKVMDAELAQLPSVENGAELLQYRLSRWTDTLAPTLSVYFPQPVSCEEVQDHYHQVATQAGWSPSGRDHTYDPEVKENYHKVAGDFSLNLAVICDEGTAGASYNLRVDVPFPYAIRIIGPWWPKG